MKILKTSLAVMATLLAFIGCKEKKEKEVVTYRFTNVDQQKLLPHYTNGSIFTFTNSNNEERKFEVVNIEQKVMLYDELGGMGGFYKTFFYYETKRITLKDYRNEKHYVILIYKSPKDFSAAKDNIYKEFPSHLVMEMYSDPYETEYEAWGRFQHSFYYGTPTISLSSNGRTFKKVHIIERDPKNLIGMGVNPNEWENTDFGGLFNMAKYTYYDEDYGIVRFETYDGHQWILE